MPLPRCDVSISAQTPGLPTERWQHQETPQCPGKRHKPAGLCHIRRITWKLCRGQSHISSSWLLLLPVIPEQVTSTKTESPRQDTVLAGEYSLGGSGFLL